MIPGRSKAQVGQLAQEARDDIHGAAQRLSDASSAAMGAFLLVSAVSVVALVFAVLAYRRTGV